MVSFQQPDDTLTYERYFGLNEKPFSLNSDPRFVYDSPTYVATSAGLLAGIRRREGLLVLTGEIGTGKTTLCRAVLRDLGRKTYSSLVPDPFASREDLLKMLLIDFGVLSIQELTSGPLRGASRTELGYLLSEFLNSLTPESFVVVIIDEAQNLSLPLIEEMRILSDTFGARGRLQIVFAGQPELHAKLKLPEMRQVDQRVCGYHRLEPMSRDAVAGYIQHRLQVAGGQRDRVLFAPAIVELLHQRCGGVPRLINRVCDRALHVAFERRAAGVDRDIVDSALIEVGSATLSPTWDSIMFAAPQAEGPGSTLAPAPAAVTAPEPAAKPAAEPAPLPTPRATETAPPIDPEHFEKQIDHWVEKDLAPPSRTLTSLQTAFADEAPAQGRRPAPKTARKEVAKSTTVKTAWPRDIRSETYLQRRWRRWRKRVAIAAGVFLAVNAAIVGGSLVSSSLTSPVYPALPKSPAVVVPGLAALEVPPADRPAAAAESSIATPTVAVADAGEYLVAVGLFTSERADQLVEALTLAGLPAMQRSFQLRQREVQQIVLGPFFSRADAAADLRRLKDLGGYDDASVIADSQ